MGHMEFNTQNDTILLMNPVRSSLVQVMNTIYYKRVILGSF